jgi:pimeloyl-ACP methyl ester carboxylesterase
VREILIIRAGRDDIVGTYHRPTVRGDVGTGAREAGVACVFVNAGHLPRDGHAGIMVETAERLAARGYPVFRFDLPGLGDSPGEVPADLNRLFAMMGEGRYVEPLKAVVAEVRKRYGIPRVVLGGLCGGAVASVMAAVQVPASIAGIVALELELVPPTVEGSRSLVGRLFARDAWLRVLAGESRANRYVPALAALLPRAVGRALLPRNANVAAIEALAQFLDSGAPMLLVMAGGRLRDSIYRQIRGAVLPRGSDRRVWRRSIPGTNHIFTTGMAKPRVVEEVGAWCDEFFAPWSHDPVPALARESCLWPRQDGDRQRVIARREMVD